MEKEKFKTQCKFYTPYIEKLINENNKFYRYDGKIRWCFGFDENASLMAVCNKKTNVITINLNSVMISYKVDNLRQVEYYLLHEIRHTFQNAIINDYQNQIDIPLDKEIVEKWIYERENYVKSTDDEGNENREYFFQDCEMDAYAFSLAVMKYKYNDISNLYIPKVYGKEFYAIVNLWIEVFKKESL